MEEEVMSLIADLEKVKDEEELAKILIAELKMYNAFLEYFKKEKNYGIRNE